MADENNQNMQEVLMLPGIILVLSVIIVIALIITGLVPSIRGYMEAQGQYKTLLSEQSTKEQTLETLRAAKEAEENQQEASVGASKEFFRPLETGSDTESVIASEFNEILSLMTANAIKTRSVKYTYDPEDDSFVRGAGDRFSVCKLDMSMIATYNDFKNFMKELYKHEHYLDIAKVEIVPYQKNKTILLIELQLKLYAEKG